MNIYLLIIYNAELRVLHELLFYISPNSRAGEHEFIQIKVLT